MESIDLQKIILDNDKKHIKRVLLIIVLTILVCILAIWIFSKRQDGVLAEQVRVQQDSLKAHDKRYQVQITSLQHTYDSSITAIQDQQDELLQQLTSIQNHYDKVRKQLNTSPVDNRLRVFSGHLPQTGTPRK